MTTTESIQSWIRNNYSRLDTRNIFWQIWIRQNVADYFRQTDGLSPELRTVYQNGLWVSLIEIDELERLLKTKNKEGA